MILLLILNRAQIQNDENNKLALNRKKKVLFGNQRKIRTCRTVSSEHSFIIVFFFLFCAGAISLVVKNINKYVLRSTTAARPLGRGQRPHTGGGENVGVAEESNGKREVNAMNRRVRG